MKWDLFLGCLPHTITDLELASKLINMCEIEENCNMLYRATLPDSRVTSVLPGHRAASRQQDQMLAGIFVY